MKKPKFQVGDRVQFISAVTGKVISSDSYVLSVGFDEISSVTCPITGDHTVHANQFHYEITGIHKNIIESSLHPYPQQKHEPAEFTFSALMDDLKTGVVA